MYQISSVSISAYTKIIFEITVVNADRKVGKIKVGAQIIARR